MPITRQIAALLFAIVVAGLSIAFICTVVIPPIHYLFTTVAKALALALGA